MNIIGSAEPVSPLRQNLYRSLIWLNMKGHHHSHMILEFLFYL